MQHDTTPLAFTDAETAAVRRHLLTLYASARRNFTREEQLKPGEQLTADEYPRLHRDLGLFYADTLNEIMGKQQIHAYFAPTPGFDGSCYIRLMVPQGVELPAVGQFSEQLASLDLNAPVGEKEFMPFSAVHHLRGDRTLRRLMVEPFLQQPWQQKVGTAVDRAQKAWGCDPRVG